MAQQLIYSDGASAKNLNPWDVDGNPEAWTWLSNAPQKEIDAMPFRVAASYRAVFKRATAAANVPFQLSRGKTVIADNKEWGKEGRKYLAKPRDLIKRISLSLTFTNKAYLLPGKDILTNVKGYNFLVPTTVTEITTPATGLFDY